MQIKIQSSHKKVEFYHFKVMQLKTHEDTEAGSECKLRFHFFFKKLAEKKRAYLKDFGWDVNNRPNQRLYLSRDTNRLMEVINNFTATVYTRCTVQERSKSISTQSLKDTDNFSSYEHHETQRVEDNGQQVEWKVEF